MRRAPTLILVCLALPLTAAGGPVVDNESKLYLSVALMGGPRIQAHSPNWTRNSSTGKVTFNPFSIAKKTDRTSPTFDRPPPGAASNEMVMNDTRGGEKAGKDLQAQDKLGNFDVQSGPSGVRKDLDSGLKDLQAQDKLGNSEIQSAPGANEILTVGSNRTESGQATGKRTHMPLRSRMIYDQGLSPEESGPGTLTVAGRFPGCRVGARYPSATVSDGSVRFVIDGVTVAACPAGAGPTETVTFSYGTLKVR